MKTRRIIFTGGGTGGHIFPILEVAGLLQKRRRNLEMLYVGGRNNLEAKIVPDHLNFEGINVGKLKREVTLNHIKEAVRVASGLVSAHRIVKGFKPNLIFAKGGYVSLPILAIASAKKIPVVCHESDSVLGLANRFSVKVAQKICLGFPLQYYPAKIQKKAVFTGVPIRAGFYVASSAKDRQLFGIKKNFQTILITGGSQGAAAINQAVKPLLPIWLRKYQVIHLTGEYQIKDFNRFKENLPSELRGNYHQFSFLTEGMESAVKVSDLVISRAGSALFEFCAAGLPMILIPLPSAAGGHQHKNAEIITKEGAAVTILQNYLTTHRLQQTAQALLGDRHRLEQMKKFAQSFSTLDSVDRVVRVIEEVLS